MTENTVLHGACLCGDVTYSSEYTHSDMWNCHCKFCRKSSSVAYATWIKTPRPAFWWGAEKSPRVQYKTPDDIVRSFCSRCGSILPAHNEKEDCIYLPASGISTEHDLCPTADHGTDHMPAWYRMKNHHPLTVPVSNKAETTAGNPHMDCQGSCLCGKITYRISGAADAIRGCHCSRCRRRSGSGFFAAMPMMISDFQITGDKDHITSFFLQGSQYYGYSFCNSCGTLIPGIFPDGKRTIVAMGSMDTEPLLPLTYHIYVSSKAPWLEIRAGDTCFAEQPPPDYDWRLISLPCVPK